MGLSKTGIIFLISLFFISTITLQTAIGSYYNEDTGLQQTNINETGFFKDLFNNFITGFTILPIWINSLIYGTLLITATFIILSSLPTFSGGS